MERRTKFYCNDYPTPKEYREMRMKELFNQMLEIANLSDEECEEIEKEVY